MILGIIQASNCSLRLPGKATATIKVGKEERTLLDLMLERVKKSGGVEKWVVATTTNSADNEVWSVATKAGMDVHRAPGRHWLTKRKNVLKQFYDIAREQNANCIVRLTGDCPLIDPNIIDRVCWQFIMNRNAADYISNCWYRSFPRGQDVEIFSRGAIDHLFKDSLTELVTPYDREHVTTVFRRNPKIFPNMDVQPINGTYESGEPASEAFDARLTVDYPEDLELVRAVFKGLYKKDEPPFRLLNIKAFLDEHPKVAKLNAHIKQVG